MLKDKLYSIISIANAEGKITAELELNSDDDIFKGHFPGQPVLPAACMLQMLKEIIQLALNKKIRLKKADQMKFLSVVDPSVNGNLQLNAGYSINGNNIVVNATLSTVNGACFKFKGNFL